MCIVVIVRLHTVLPGGSRPVAARSAMVRARCVVDSKSERLSCITIANKWALWAWTGTVEKNRIHTVNRHMNWYVAKKGEGFYFCFLLRLHHVLNAVLGDVAEVMNLRLPRIEASVSFDNLLSACCPMHTYEITMALNWVRSGLRFKFERLKPRNEQMMH